MTKMNRSYINITRTGYICPSSHYYKHLRNGFYHYISGHVKSKTHGCIDIFKEYKCDTDRLNFIIAEHILSCHDNS